MDYFCNPIEHKEVFMQNLGISMLWFWVSYIIVTVIGILHTVFNIYVLKMKPMDEKGNSHA